MNVEICVFVQGSTARNSPTPSPVLYLHHRQILVLQVLSRTMAQDTLLQDRRQVGDCKLEIYISSIGRIRFEIRGGFDIVRFNKAISEHVLA